MKGILSCLIVMSSSLASASNFGPAFERLKGLVGTWDVEGSDRHVVYSLSGGGETVVEDVRGEKTMATFYHMDGSSLRLTHYGAAGNQPRMKAVSYDEARGVLKFEFLDGTNLAGAASYHSRDLEIRFLGPDRVELEFIGSNSRQDKLWAVLLNDGGERSLTDFRGRPGEMGSWGLATDGEYLYCTWRENLGDPWVADFIFRVEPTSAQPRAGDFERPQMVGEVVLDDGQRAESWLWRPSRPRYPMHSLQPPLSWCVAPRGRRRSLSWLPASDLLRSSVWHQLSRSRVPLQFSRAVSRVAPGRS